MVWFYRCGISSALALDLPDAFDVGAEVVLISTCVRVCCLCIVRTAHSHLDAFTSFLQGMLDSWLLHWQPHCVRCYHRIRLPQLWFAALVCPQHIFCFGLQLWCGQWSHEVCHTGEFAMVTMRKSMSHCGTL